MSQEDGKLVTTTIRDYDLSETSKLLRGAYMGIAMMAFLHGYLKCVILFSFPYVLALTG
jgi:hypothetical protein